MLKILAPDALALAGTVATAAIPVLYEEAAAHQEEALIIKSPIANIENDLWFDYNGNILEAKKELSSDVGRASDTEDLRDAWDEYRGELKHEREHYVSEMAEEGYVTGYAIIEG